MALWFHRNRVIFQEDDSLVTNLASSVINFVRDWSAAQLSDAEVVVPPSSYADVLVSSF